MALRIRKQCKRAKKVNAKNDVKKGCYRDVGLEFFKAACKVLIEETICDGASSAHSTAWCERHQQKCPVVKAGGASGIGAKEGTIALIAGVSCFDWSPMGEGEGWLGKSTLVLLQFLKEFVDLKPHWAVLECVLRFDESTALDCLLEEYLLRTICSDPSRMGMPCRRPRKYMLLIRKDSLRWRSAFPDDAAQHMYDALFTKKTCMTSESFACAPADKIQEHKDLLATKRGLPLRRRGGKPWSFFQVLPSGIRRRIVKHEERSTLEGQTGWHLSDVTQTPGWVKDSIEAPVLLQRSQLWASTLSRMLLPLEHFELMGYPVWAADGDSFRRSLDQLAIAQQRSLVGNGMHATSIGTIILFLMATVEFL